MDPNNPFAGGLGGIMEMAQKLQADLAKKQEELTKHVETGSAGGGMVEADVNGAFEVVAIRIETEVVDPSEVGMLQDLIIAAVNQGVSKIRKATQDQMGQLSGVLPPELAGMFGK